MKHSLKISLMALVAMFAFNTTADAQFGGLLKKAKQAVSSKPKESAFDKRKREEREKKEAEWEAEVKKEYEVKNWKTGGIMIVAKVFPTNKPVSAKEASAGYDFDDKENKQGIVKQLLTFLDSNKSKLQYLQDLKLGDAFVGRKVVAVFFRNKDWIVDTNALGVPIRRRVFLNIISELGSGITVAEDYEVWNAYQGNGKYSGLYEFGVTRKNGSSDYYKRTIANQWMITDWVHDPNADPMAEFK